MMSMLCGSGCLGCSFCDEDAICDDEIPLSEKHARLRRQAEVEEEYRVKKCLAEGKPSLQVKLGDLLSKRR